MAEATARVAGGLRSSTAVAATVVATKAATATAVPAAEATAGRAVASNVAYFATLVALLAAAAAAAAAEAAAGLCVRALARQMAWIAAVVARLYRVSMIEHTHKKSCRVYLVLNWLTAIAGKMALLSTVVASLSSSQFCSSLSY